MDKKIIDSHLITSYLINEEPNSYKIARDFFDLVKLGKKKAILEQAVFTETVITLETLYAVPRNKIREVLSSLLEYKGIYNPEKDVLLEALCILSESSLPIVESIIAAKAKLQSIATLCLDQKIKNYFLSNISHESNN